jgi:very-short-patch-repair endonuclease
VAYKRSKTDINNLPELKTFRRELRSNMTPAEARFWTMVKGSRLDGRKFRRQHGVGPYILDFYCPGEQIAVELDGAVHSSDAAREYDLERKLFLEHFNILVLRFENRLVFEDPDWVLANIRHRFGWRRIIEEGPDSK